MQELEAIKKRNNCNVTYILEEEKQEEMKRQVMNEADTHCQSYFVAMLRTATHFQFSLPPPIPRLQCASKRIPTQNGSWNGTTQKPARKLVIVSRGCVKNVK
jgi:hypothetical protein